MFKFGWLRLWRCLVHGDLKKGTRLFAKQKKGCGVPAREFGLGLVLVAKCQKFEYEMASSIEG